MSPPTVHRAHLPAAYHRAPDPTQLTWEEVNERLRDARHYWIGTIGESGPTVRPIDGMWLDCALYFGSARTSRWRRNLATDPRVSVHLEEAERAVIVEGVVEAIRVGHDLALRLTEAANAKYDMGQTVTDYEGHELGVMRPQVVLAWNTLGKDATRFVFS